MRSDFPLPYAAAEQGSERDPLKGCQVGPADLVNVDSQHAPRNAAETIVAQLDDGTCQGLNADAGPSNRTDRQK